MKPNLNRIIEDNLDKAKFQSKLQPSLPKNTGWLDGYADGGLLSKKVTCSNCGWSWKAVDGGINPMTCHKCGGMIKMKQGGSYNEFPEGGLINYNQLIGLSEEKPEPMFPYSQDYTNEQYKKYLDFNSKLGKGYDNFDAYYSSFKPIGKKTNTREGWIMTDPKRPDVTMELEGDKNNPPEVKSRQKLEWKKTSSEEDVFPREREMIMGFSKFNSSHPNTQNQYKSGGTYISDKALATQFGQYGNGGKTGPKLPIIINNPNDPRLKAYNDSLSKYNITQDLLNNKIITKQNFDKAIKIQGNLAFPVTSYYNPNNKNEWWGNYSTQIKKPVQPVVYQKPKPSFKDFVKTANPDYMSDDYDLEAAYKNLPEKTMKAWAKDPEKNHLPDTYKKPNHPTFSKESIYYNPGMEAGTWRNDVYIPNRGQIVGRENNLQVSPETGLIDRLLQRINTEEQPTNYSFHYPIEGTFDRANPQGVKYFNDRAEWQKFLDENDYNSAEEKNGSGQASGTLKKGKYGGWLDKYPEGGENSTGYVAPTMPDLRHPGEGSVYQHIDRTIPLMGSTVPNNPDIVRKIEKETAAKELALRKQASQVMKQKGNTHFTFPNGDYKPYKDMNFRERSYVEGLALDQDTRLNEDEDSVLDFFNPLHQIGSLGKGLAQAPYVAKQTDSYLPYVTGIGNPLLAGRMMGSGSMNPLSSKMWTNEISNKEFANILAGGIPGAIKKIPSTLKNAGKYLTEETPLKNFSKNFETNSSVLNSKKPEYHTISFPTDEAVEKGIQTSRNTIETEGKKILEDLNSTEGRSRLKNQFKLADPTLNEDQLNYLVDTRLKEVSNSFNNSLPKFYQEVVSNNPVYNKQNVLEWRNYVYPKKNAHWSSENYFTKSQNAPESLFPNNKLNLINENNPSVINLKKKSGYDIFTDPNYSPGSVTLGEGLENNIVVLDHEGGHAIQKGGVMPIDTQLQELVRSKNPFDKIFQKSLNKESIKDRYYFRTADGRTYKNEAYPFLVEQRKRMIEDGILKNRYDEVTPLKLLKARLNASKNVNENFIEGNRLIKITPPWKYNKLAKIMNTAPAVIPAVGTVGIGAAALKEEKYGGDISIPDLNNNKQFKNNNMAKYGGWLSKYEDGSVVDYLADKNQDFSYSNRKELAKKLGIENYEGTADQNLQMLDKLKQSENVVTGKRYVKPPAQGIYFEDGVDVRTPDVPQKEVPKVKEKQKVVNKIPEYDPFGFIKEAVKNNNTPTKSPLPQPTSAPAARKINEPSWYDKVGDWFGGMENTLSKIKENTLGRPGFIPDNNKTKFTPPNSYVPPNSPKPKVVEGTKKDSRYLESGMIEDKNKGEMYVIKNGKVVKTMPILTGLNKNGEVNDKDYKYLHDHPEEGPKLKATPTGTYLSVPNPNLYGYPGFNMNPIPAFGQPAPRGKDLAQHVIYGAGPKGSDGYDPVEGARRTKIMQGPGENRVGSFGCTNMYGQDINCLTGQLFPKGDTTIVVDSRRPADQSFLKNTYGVKKMGGEPCYNCGGMYNKGGQTNWLDKYK
jgi:hypothetical protein